MRKTTVKRPIYSRRDFMRDFPDDEACLEYLRWDRWPSELIPCVNCERDTKHHLVKARKSYSCDRCGHHVHPTAGTIFHKSRTPLLTWFQAIYLMSATRCGISAMQLMRETGVTYKTAHRMFRLIRTLLNERDDIAADPLSGVVEMDATFLNPKRRLSDPPGRPGKSLKERAIMGAVERGGRVVALYVGGENSIEAEYMLKAFVLPSAVVHTDESRAYMQVTKTGRRHELIKHSEKVYVDGDVHTQTIEGFWSNFKRGTNGVYHSMSKKYLQNYLDEYCYRYNHRDDQTPMFWSFLSRVARVASSASGLPDGSPS